MPSKKVFIFHPFLKDTFAGSRTLGWQFFFSFQYFINVFLLSSCLHCFQQEIYCPSYLCSCLWCLCSLTAFGDFLWCAFLDFFCWNLLRFLGLGGNQCVLYHISHSLSFSFPIFVSYSISLMSNLWHLYSVLSAKPHLFKSQIQWSSTIILMHYSICVYWEFFL